MPRISLTDMVDVVSSSGVPKATKIGQIKRRPEYQPAADFYKALREAIIDMHQRAAPKSELDKVAASLRDPKKRKNYPDAIAGYKKWLGRKKLVWFDPPRDELSHHGVDVIVNPELGLGINGERHIVKLYFKAYPLSKLRVDVITTAMEDCLRPHVRRKDNMTVVDVRRGKAFSTTGASAKLSAVVKAELAYLAAMWPHI